MLTGALELFVIQWTNVSIEYVVKFCVIFL